jgi:hypothetical protein
VGRISSVIVAGVLVVAALACGGSGGGGGAGPPQATAERALLIASRGQKLPFAKLLASGPRGKSSADVQLEILSEWLHLRSMGALDLSDATLEGWDALRIEESTSANATVATVLRFRRPADEPPERPVPLEIDLVMEGGRWRIADARMAPLPAWWKQRHEENHPTFPGEPPEPMTQPPTLAEIAATYRPPPPDYKR